LVAGGCKWLRSNRVTPARVHQITQELAKAAAAAAPRGTVIKLRRARSSSGAGGPEEIRIGFRGDAEAANQLRQSLHDVATRNRLTVDAESKNGNILRIVLRSGGTPTHRIEIEYLNSLDTTSTTHDRTATARLAILLDDLGNDRKAAEAIFALHVPITLSVLPYHEHSQDIAKEARKHGCEVMLHLPMQSVANETPEQEELKPGLSQQQVEEIVDKMLEALPEADGVNNHQGSQATANTALMNELMPVLRDAGMFYVDSRTTAATVAFETAKRDGVRAAFRNVPFLDDVQDQAAVKRQLQIAMRGAKAKGEAIAIGHPHPETLAALRELLPEAKKQGVRLVLVSELVR
jgi:polysaccharide deacetylase 2 family uncharacterized protein YibQ